MTPRMCFQYPYSIHANRAVPDKSLHETTIDVSKRQVLMDELLTPKIPYAIMKVLSLRDNREDK